MTLSPRSLKALQGVHPDLVRVVHRAAEIGPAFVVTEGVRSRERQAQLKAAGTIARLTAELVETKADLERFRANIREIGAHLATERAA